MDFDTRYSSLNTNQRRAVDTIDGPVMVIAGPGTGKTELLGMRVANILRKTDTLPESILCLTFTESGAHAMRDRLSSIIGKDAYKVAIHTFHSFGSEVINQNGDVVGTKVIKGAGNGLDEAAQKAVMQAKFKPGLIKGKPVKCEVAIPIMFKLQ